MKTNVTKLGDSLFTFLSGGWKDELGTKKEFEEENRREQEEKNFKLTDLESNQ